MLCTANIKVFMLGGQPGLELVLARQKIKFAQAYRQVYCEGCMSVFQRKGQDILILQHLCCCRNMISNHNLCLTIYILIKYFFFLSKVGY